jgi:hypothetical protein
MQFKVIYLIAHICVNVSQGTVPNCVSLSDWHDTNKECLSKLNEIENILLENNLERINYELECI